MTKSLEDYLEVIYQLSLTNQFIRVSYVAKKLNVSNSSVNNAIKELTQRNLITHQKYGMIELTESGLVEAKKITGKHTLLKSFFVNVLKVSESNAESDACAMEHFISEESLKQMIQYMKNNTQVDQSLNLNENLPRVYTLNKAEPGKPVTIFKIACSDCVESRLQELGLLEKDKIEVIKNEKDGPLILKIKGCNMIVGRGICGKILVKDAE